MFDLSRRIALVTGAGPHYRSRDRGDAGEDRRDGPRVGLITSGAP
jgi:hypothetical protein